MVRRCRSIQTDPGPKTGWVPRPSSPPLKPFGYFFFFLPLPVSLLLQTTPSSSTRTPVVLCRPSNLSTLHSVPSPCSYLHWFSVIFSYTTQQTVPPLPSGILLHTTQNQIICIQEARQSPLSPILQESHLPPSHLHLHLLHRCIHIHNEQPKGHDKLLSHPTIYPKPFTHPILLTQAELSIYILLIPLNNLPPHHSLNTCQRASRFTVLYAFSRSIKLTYTLHFFLLCFLTYLL